MNLLSINDLSKLHVKELFDLADRLKVESKDQLLKGKTVILFFPESSIRTRVTFEKAVSELGGKSILFPSSTLDKREELRDVIRYIENWADAVIVRHSDLSKLKELSKYSKIPIVNAMTKENHPCEILSDIYSISKIRDDYRDINYTFVGGDGNIARSWITAADKLDLKLKHVCVESNRIRKDNKNYTFSIDLNKVLIDTDVLLTDPLNDELRNRDYYEKYQITLARLEKTKENSIFNPCPPFFRGEEVSEDAINSKYFVGYKFKENLLYVEQAIIIYCLLN